MNCVEKIRLMDIDYKMSASNRLKDFESFLVDNMKNPPTWFSLRQREITWMQESMFSNNPVVNKHSIKNGD